MKMPFSLSPFFCTMKGRKKKISIDPGNRDHSYSKGEGQARPTLLHTYMKKKSF